jgi:hypothetical protein
VELEVEVVGPDFGREFRIERIDGVDVQQTFTRSMPTAEDLQQFFLLVRDGAAAGYAVLKIAEILRRILAKRPDLKQTMRIRVRMGRRITETDVARISEIGCDVEFVRESVERFEGGAPIPPSVQARSGGME